MSKEELQEVADDADSLTDIAGAALRREMLRRGMEAPPEARIQPEGERQFSGPVIIRRYRDLPVALWQTACWARRGFKGSWPTIS